MFNTTSYNQYGRDDAWTLIINITAPGEEYGINISGTSINITVDWGDGTIQNFTTIGNKARTYSSVGQYRVRIYGSLVGGIRQHSGTSYSRAAKVISTSPIRGITGFEVYANTFRGCTNLTSLPSSLFNPPNPGNLSSTTAFSNTFDGCTSLTEIPEDLFRKKISNTIFNNTFANCTNLTSIPPNLFRYNTLATSFTYVFWNCSNLSSVPGNLFLYNTQATNFTGTFQGCNNLSSVPDNFFLYNTQATSFIGTFRECNNLSLSSNIFGSDLSTRFLNQSVDFTDCFKLTSIFTGTQGTAPELWNANYGTGTPVTTNCFNGHDSTSLSNYLSIPPAWI